MLLRTAAFAALLSSAMAVAGTVDEARQAYLQGDYELALEVLEPAAHAGDANAQNIMGDAHYQGNGVARDLDKAREWWELSAEQGFDKAQYNLGQMLATGIEGIAADPARAQVLFQAAMDQGNADAFNEMGLLFAYGRGRPVDHAQAVTYYRQGHELGSRIATSNLGAAYAKAEGVAQDYAQAFTFTLQAAQLGEPQALNNMGLFYENGYHVQKDPVAALIYYREAAGMGRVRAGHDLADLLDQPGYFWSDPIEALAYCLWSELNAGPGEVNDLYLDCQAMGSALSDTDRAEAAILAEAL